MSKKLLDVGPLEMEALGLLNAHGEQSVGDLQKGLKQAGHDLAYTTVMTVLVRLYQKGLVQRRKESRHFIYSTAKRKENSPSRIFERVKNSLFGSEKLQPILALINSDESLSREELEQLKRAVEDRMKKTRS